MRHCIADYFAHDHIQDNDQVHHDSCHAHNDDFGNISSLFSCPWAHEKYTVCFFSEYERGDRDQDDHDSY